MMKKDNFDKIQYYERLFHTAVNAQWVAYPGKDALNVMLEVWKDETGADRQRFNYDCGNCVLDLVTDLGKMYFAEKERRAKKVTASETETSPAKVTVKTNKSKKGKK